MREKTKKQKLILIIYNVQHTYHINGFEVKKNLNFLKYWKLSKEEKERRMTFKIPLSLSDLENDNDDEMSVKEIVDMSTEESIRTNWKNFQSRLKNVRRFTNFVFPSLPFTYFYTYIYSFKL